MSDFWIRKMKTYFQRHDVNNDRTLTKDDFAEFGKKFADHNKLDEEQGNTVKSQIMEVWSSFTNGKVDTVLTEDQFIELVKTQRSDPAFSEAISGALRITFKVVDTNGNGVIQLEELVAFFESFGLHESIAPASFQAIDADGDGEISVEEFVASGLSFFISEDEAHPSKFFIGQLI